LVITAIIFSLSSCEEPFKSDYRDHLSSVSSATAPDTVAVGTTFQVLIVTSGSNGCWKKGDDRVSQQGPLQVYIVPFDREYVGTGACTADVPQFQHTVNVGASAKGTMDIFVSRRLRAVAGADSTGVIQLKVDVR